MPTPAALACPPNLMRALTLPTAFVVGCQKSGTTWVQHLLAAHPEVCSRGEARLGTLLFPLFAQVARTYNEQQRAGQVNRLEDPQLREIARVACASLFARWLDAHPDTDRVRLIAEKTPEQAQALPLLDAVFPECRVVHVIRDGRDCVVSGWFHNIRENEQKFRVRFPTMTAYAEFFARDHWAPYIRAARSWGLANPARYLELRYEDLLERPHEGYAALFAFLGVSADDTTVDACVERTSFKAMTGRTPGDENASSHFRKGVAGDWREHLDPAALAAFERPVRDLMRELAYEPGASHSVA